MTREEKLNAIYKEMANTDIDEWCIIEAYWERWVILDYNWTRAYVWWFRWDFEKFDDYQHLSIKLWYEVIWRPVMIWDVLRQIRLLAGYALDNDLIKKSDFWNVIAQHNYRITQIWEDFREPIDTQSDECIDFVYSLIQK